MNYAEYGVQFLAPVAIDAGAKIISSVFNKSQYVSSFTIHLPLSYLTLTSLLSLPPSASCSHINHQIINS